MNVPDRAAAHAERDDGKPSFQTPLARVLDVIEARGWRWMLISGRGFLGLSQSGISAHVVYSEPSAASSWKHVEGCKEAVDLLRDVCVCAQWSASEDKKQHLCQCRWTR